MAQGYEILIVLQSETPEDEIEKQISKAKEVINESKGEFLNTKKWGQRKLVYRIKGSSKGYFLVVYFFGDSTTLNALDGLLRYNERVLRYQTIKLNKKFDFDSLQEEKPPEEPEIIEPQKKVEENQEKAEGENKEIAATAVEANEDKKQALT